MTSTRKNKRKKKLSKIDIYKETGYRHATGYEAMTIFKKRRISGGIEDNKGTMIYKVEYIRNV